MSAKASVEAQLRKQFDAYIADELERGRAHLQRHNVPPAEADAVLAYAKTMLREQFEAAIEHTVALVCDDPTVANAPTFH
jgi:hypothetical protein